jgi:hypothetical protein
MCGHVTRRRSARATGPANVVANNTNSILEVPRPLQLPDARPISGNDPFPPVQLLLLAAWRRQPPAGPAQILRLGVNIKESNALKSAVVLLGTRARLD